MLILPVKIMELFIDGILKQGEVRKLTFTEYDKAVFSDLRYFVLMNIPLSHIESSELHNLSRHVRIGSG